MMTTTTKEVILQMLELYKDMPFLWDKTHKKYKDHKTRVKGTHILLEEYKKIDEHATLKSVTKKIQNLRTGYYKELKKINDSKLNATDESEIYTPTLFYFDALNFLGGNDEYIIGDIFKTADSDGEADAASDSESECPRTSEKTIVIPTIENRLSASYERQPKKRRITIPINQTIRSTTPQSILDDSSPIVKDEEWEILGKSIGLQLRDLNKTQLAIAQKMISDTIYYAKFNLLSENSFVSSGASNGGSPNHSQCDPLASKNGDFDD